MTYGVATWEAFNPAKSMTGMCERTKSYPSLPILVEDFLESFVSCPLKDLWVYLISHLAKVYLSKGYLKLAVSKTATEPSLLVMWELQP